MDRPYVEWVRIEGYRCIKSADLHLTPLHALIGPNDSGKSSILRAMLDPAELVWWTSDGAWLHGNIYPRRDDGASARGHGRSSYPDRKLPIQSDLSWVSKITQPRAILRLDPDALRARVPLIPHGEPLWFRDEKGVGLPALYDALLSRNLEAFAKINDAFRRLFPTARAIRLHNANAQEKQLGLTLVDGTEVGPAEMSEGMLYWLAFAIIEHLSPQAIILVEEPENGLHPARIHEVMEVLREVSQRTQIILATHSPLVINELKAEQVTIVTRTPERGTICTPMISTKNFEQRSKVYALGELWLSYADGNLESELMPESPEGIHKAG